MEARSNGPVNGGFQVGAFRMPPMGRAAAEVSGDGSSGEERGPRKRPRPKANSLAVRQARGPCKGLELQGSRLESDVRCSACGLCEGGGWMLLGFRHQGINTLYRSVRCGVSTAA